MEAAMRNVHVRALPVPASRVGPLIDRLSGPDDPLWPTPAWPPIRFDRPLSVGAAGGHARIRYHVTAYEPGRRIRFTFHPAIGLDGYHEFAVEPAGDHACVLRHITEGRLHGRAVVLWPLVVRWLHDALLEDLLDNAELAVTGAVARPARWSPWVRLLRARISVRPREVPVPAAAVLARSAFEKIDFQDAWQLPLPASVTSDPAAWAQAAFRSPPRWVAALLALRNALVRLTGIERGNRGAFGPVARTENELLLGTDAGHLDFRVSLLVADAKVTLSTVTVLKNARGRRYMAVVKRVHPVVARHLLASAARLLAERAPAAGLRFERTPDAGAATW